MLALDPHAQVTGEDEPKDGVLTIPITGLKEAAFDQTLWTLLTDIHNAGVPLTGKVAEYAGYYFAADSTVAWDATSDNGTAADHAQTGTSQPNKSLDKLTFLIMFRLPFTHEVVTLSPAMTNPAQDLLKNRKILKKPDNSYVIGAFSGSKPTFQLCTITRPNAVAGFDLDGRDLYYDTASAAYRVPGAYTSHLGDPLANSGTSWSARANAIRANLGLKKLNKAGEQVAMIGGSYKLVDDGGNEISFDFVSVAPANNAPPTPTAAAYTYYGIDFNDLHPDEKNNKISSASVIKDVKRTPLYYFLTVFTENSPDNYEQKPHFPEKTIQEIYARRPITFSVPVTGVEGKLIAHDIGGYYATGAAKYYLTEDLLGLEDFSKDQFYKPGNTLAGMIVRLESGKYYAENTSIIKQMKTPKNSGLTFGYGWDIGGTYRKRNCYKVVFTIQKLSSATGTFKLWYGGKESAAIDFAASEDVMQTALCKLMGLEKEIVDVTYLAGTWSVTIQQRIDARKNYLHPWTTYCHELIYKAGAGENPAKITIAQPNDSDRYRERLASEFDDGKSGLDLIEEKLNGFFESGDYLHPDPVNDESHTTGFVPITFQQILKEIVGLKSGPARIIYLNNREMIERFKMPNAGKAWLKNYEHIFVAGFFKNTLYTSKVLNVIEDNIEPNVLEKTLFATISYGGIVNWEIDQYQVDTTTWNAKVDSHGKLVQKKRVIPDIVVAISSHDHKLLKDLFIRKNPDLKRRRTFLVGYMEKFHHIVYRGVEA